MLELDEIQGIVTSGFSHWEHARFFFLRVEDRTKAKAWLRGVLPFVTTSARRPKGDPKPDAIVQIGFTKQGLVAMGLNDDCVNQFPREFTIGMAEETRSKVLGDSGESAPEKWQVGGRGMPDVHLLLMLYARTKKEVDRVMGTRFADAAANGLNELYRQESHRTNAYEPFGFRDGISQPAIEGVEGGVLPGQAVLKPGEFVLGYDTGYGQPGTVPVVPASLDVNHDLPADGANRSFGRNGTFLVYRKLAQDVAGFWQYVESQAKKPDGTVDEAMKELLAAKIVGRWKSGAPLTLAPGQDDPKLGEDYQRNNDFNFMPTDAEGFGCPIGSHIRRSNPRDMQRPNPKKSLVISDRHRIIRRGRHYREGNEEGLLFICVNADIQRQFEFIQQTWINNAKFDGLYDEKDPLMGDNDGGKGTFTIQRCPVRHRVQGLPRFVHVRGGGYFFLPSLSALKYLSNPG